MKTTLKTILTLALCLLTLCLFASCGADAESADNGITAALTSETGEPTETPNTESGSGENNAQDPDVSAYGDPVETWNISAPYGGGKVIANLYDDPDNEGSHILVIDGEREMDGWSYGDWSPWYSSYRTTISSVIIGNNVETIGQYAFYSCENLTSVVIGNSIRQIYGTAFSGCTSLKSIVIPDSVTSISSSAFSGCTSLTSVVIGKGVTSIGHSAFSRCASLTSIVIPDSVTSIDNYAFYNCQSLTNVVIGEEVKSIGMEAFSYCGFTRIVIPDSVTSIDKRAFYHCMSLTSVEIGDSVTSIGIEAFSECKSLTSITVDENNQSYKSIDENLYTKDGKTLIQYAVGKTDTSFTVPSSVTSISDKAFYACISLTSVVISGNVTSIGGSAFYNCTHLMNVEIGEGVTSIGDHAFYNCKRLTSVVIGEGVTSIGNYAFCRCSSLTNIVIPNSVTSIGSGAFSDCSSLYVVYNYSDLSFEIGNTSNGHVTYYAKILVDHGNTTYVNDGYEYILTDDGFLFRYDGKIYRLIAYYGEKETVTLSDDINGSEYEIYEMRGVVNVVIPNSIKTIRAYAFDHCATLTSVVIPDSVTSIGEYAFNYCTSLKNIEIPDSVTSIGQEAFYNCQSLTNIEFGNSVTAIANYAFSNCTNLSDVYFNGTEEEWAAITIGTSNENLTNAKIHFLVESWDISATEADNVIAKLYTAPENEGFYVLVIAGEGAMKDWSYNGTPWYYYRSGRINNIIIKDNVTNIGSYAFYYCTSLINVVIGNSVTSIGDYAFQHCDSLTSVVIPDSVTSIGDYAFAYCESLTSVVIPGNVTSIGSAAFSGCNSLTSVVICEGVTSIGSSAFAHCTSLTNVVIGNGVTNIGNSVFYNCVSLYVVYNYSSLTLEIGSTSNGYVTYYAKILIDHGNTTYANDGYEYILTEDDFLFKYDGTTYTLIAYCSGKETVTLPNDINGSKYEINCMRGVINVIIPDSITSIGSSAFYECTSLKGIVIPDGVTSINSYAFKGCTSLKSVVIPDSVTSIGSYAFSGCASLTSVVIGKGVTSIGSNAFTGCTGLTSIVIPDGVTTIGQSAFLDCTSLTSVVIPDSVTYIGLYAFLGCTSLTSITVDENNEIYKSIDGNLYKKDGKTLLLYAVGKKNTSFTIPSGVTGIGAYAFYKSTNLTSVVISSGVTSIESEAFRECKNLTSIVISDSVTSIGSYAFAYCESLTSIVIPGSVTSIGSSAFAYCDSLASIVIPNSITRIASSAFAYCKSLTSIVIPGGVTSIGDYTFYYCTNLSDVYFNGTEEEWAAITIGRNNENLTNAKLHFLVESWDISANEDDSVISYLYVDPENAGSYILVLRGNGATKDWNDDSVAPWYSYNGEINSVIIKYGITNIGDRAFYQCTGLTNIVIPDSIITIGDSAFYGCTSLANIDIPDSVTSIGNSAFYGCKSFRSIVIPDSVTSIGGSAFALCTNLKAVYFNGTAEEWTAINADINNEHLANANIHFLIESWDVSSSEDDNVVAKLYLNSIDKESLVLIISGKGMMTNWETVKAVPWYTSYRADIKEVIIKDKITTIGRYAFYQCTNLVRVEMGNDVATIYKSAFAECTNLTDINLSEGLISIEDTAFSSCTSLKNIVIPEVVYRIGSGAFQMCTSLTSIVIPDRVAYIGQSAFYYCSSLTNVVIGKGVTDIASYAFGTCYNLKTVTINSPTIANAITSSSACGNLITYAETIMIPASITNIGSYIKNNYGCLSATVIDGIDYVVYEKHVTVSHEAKAPTCTESGWAAYVTCSNCTYTTFSELAALGHAWSEWTETTAPTYSEEGAAERHCTNDTSHTESKVLDKLVASVTPDVETSEDGKTSSSASVDEESVTVIPEDDNVVIDTTTESAVDSAKLDISASLIEAMQGKNVTVNNNMGSLILNAIASAKLAAAGKDVSVVISVITTDKEAESGKRVYSIEVGADGIALLPPDSEETNGTVTLSLYYEKGLTLDKIKVSYRADDGEKTAVKVTSYDPETGLVTFETRHLSVFEIETVPVLENGISTSLLLGSDLSVNAYVDLESCENVTARFTMNGVSTVVEGKYVSSVGMFRFTYEGVTPIHLGDAILIEILYGDTVIAKTENYSIKRYCTDVMSMSATELGISEAKCAAMKTLAADLLDYGAAAQLYKSYKTDSLVNEGITGASAFEAVTSTDMKLTSYTTVDGLKFTSATLHFDNANSLVFKFKAPDVNRLTVRLIIGGRVLDFSAEDLVLIDGVYALYTPDVYATAFDNIYYATLIYDGVEVQTASYSVRSYVYSKQNDPDQTLSNLIRATYKYGKSAKAYAATK